MEIKKFKTIVNLFSDSINLSAESSEHTNKLVDFLMLQLIQPNCYDMIVDFVLKPYNEEDLINLYLDVKRLNLFSEYDLYKNVDIVFTGLLDYVDNGFKHGGTSVTTSLCLIEGKKGKKEFEMQLKLESNHKNFLGPDKVIESISNDVTILK
jgi:hypothetical protein